MRPEPSGPSPDAAPQPLETDVLVIGAGMGGMTAAGFSAKRGARVIVVEKGPAIGGNALLSSTTLWTAPTMEIFRERCPNGDLTLGQTLVDHFLDAVEWVRSTGVEVSERKNVLGFGRGFRFDMRDYFARCQRLVEGAGGAVTTGHIVEKLVVEDGAVVGAVVRGDEGVVEVRARATIFATGGFQASQEMRRRYLGPNADVLLLRSRPYSTGDAIRLATAVGADIAGDMGTFYGHLMAWPLPLFEADDFRFQLSFNRDGILLDVNCDRFVDESLGDQRSNQVVSKLPVPRALVVIDERARNLPPVSDVPARELISRAQQKGAHVATASDVVALGAAVDSWGFNGRRLPAAVEAFNRLVAGGDGPIPRLLYRHGLSEPPFYALEVRPSVTFTMGGLRVDSDGRVLDRKGRACRGLFAAGADVGGIYNGGYVGGLVLGCVFGTRAASKVQSELASRT